MPASVTNVKCQIKSSIPGFSTGISPAPLLFQHGSPSDIVYQFRRSHGQMALIYRDLSTFCRAKK